MVRGDTSVQPAQDPSNGASIADATHGDVSIHDHLWSIGYSGNWKRLTMWLATQTPKSGHMRAAIVTADTAGGKVSIIDRLVNLGK